MEKGSWLFSSYLFFILLLLTSFAQADTLTLTTYYPAPFGAYDQIRLVPRTEPEGKCSEGTMYVDSTSHALLFCNKSGDWSRLTVWDILFKLESDIAVKEQEIRFLEKRILYLETNETALIKTNNKLEQKTRLLEKEILDLQSKEASLRKTVDGFESRLQALEQRRRQ